MGFLRTQTASDYVVPPPSANRRSVRNIDGNNVFNYMYIDHFKMQDSWGPGSNVWMTGTNWNSAILDANGYPNHAADGRPFGGGFRMRSSLNYSGNYVFDGIGSGQIVLPGVATYTVNSGLSSNVTVNANGNWTLTGGAGAFRVVFTYTGPMQQLNYTFNSTDPSNTGAYLRNMRFYRAVDEAALIAGKVLCPDWVQMLVTESPSAFRFLDVMGVNGGQHGRWSHRTPPGYAAWTGWNWNVSPPYGDATGASNAWVTAGVAGTPTSMQHGEVATCRVVTGMVRANYGGGPAPLITDITNANPGKVTTSGPHQFATGDWVIIPAMLTGMTELNYVPVQITLDGTNPTTQFTIGISTVGFGSFIAGQGYRVCQYVTLQVGSGNDRVAYPVMRPSAFESAGLYGSDYYGGPSYMTFNFDKTISGKLNTAGVPTMGAWISRGAAANTLYPSNIGMPVEIIGTIMNELNAASSKTIDCWCPMPNASLLSMDPDYTSGEAFIPNFVNVLLNGSGSYTGLNPAINVYVENSNETWIGTPPNTQYYAFRGWFRWPASGFSDYNSYSTLRSQIMVRDMKAVFPGNTRIKYVMGGMGTYGYGGPNQIRTEGSSYSLNDVLNPSHIKPMTEHDYFAIAAYFDLASTATLAASAATWISHIGNPTAQEADCASFVNAQLLTGSGEQVSRYIGMLPGYKAGIYTPFGKQLIGYEGGWNYLINLAGRATGTIATGASTISSIGNNVTFPVGSYLVGPGISDGLTTLRPVAAASPGSATFSGGTSSISGVVAIEAYDASNLFLRACKRSQAWADAYISWFNAFNTDPAFAMPADFITLDDRWGHCWPDAYDTQFTSSTAYANMDKAWLALAARNAGFS